MLAGVEDRFGALVALPEAELEEKLDEVALLIAAAGRDLDLPWVDGQLRRLDELAGRCGPGFEGLHRHLFDELGLSGDVEGYGDPEASFLDRVLDRRAGMPIALSVLVMAVGRRVGVPVRGLGLPGHFVVVHEAEPRVVVDAFDRGRILPQEAVASIVSRATGQPVAHDPSWLVPTPASAIATRLLTNLRQRALATMDVRLLGWVAPLRCAIPGVGDGDLRLLTRMRASLS